ncbi:AcrR family transcriptional regulator [Arthrobacter sp. CAN_A2]|uniref:TetR/AcrR family transcriptional regulator n=1 Tax=Arthrobacter sp. CAN_A2 TaxID=2787718 RepID=UPI0018F01C12
MPRWPEDSRRRLVDAAISQFVDHGYAESTVENIALAAGVTPRTFFRYFADKEEVLFADDDGLLPLLIGVIAEDTGPVRADVHMGKALGTLASAVESRRDLLKRRRRIIDSHIALSGRELAKQARWQEDVTVALIDRGFPPEQSDVLAAIGFALFRQCLHAWLADDEGPGLEVRIGVALSGVPSVLDVRSSR